MNIYIWWLPKNNSFLKISDFFPKSYFTVSKNKLSVLKNVSSKEHIKKWLIIINSRPPKSNNRVFKKEASSSEMSNPKPDFCFCPYYIQYTRNQQKNNGCKERLISLFFSSFSLPKFVDFLKVQRAEAHFWYHDKNLEKKKKIPCSTYPKNPGIQGHPFCHY